ncbi:hypothetical protein ABIE12_001746 [Serratia sp. 509]
MSRFYVAPLCYMQLPEEFFQQADPMTKFVAPHSFIFVGMLTQDLITALRGGPFSWPAILNITCKFRCNSQTLKTCTKTKCSCTHKATKK